MVRLSIFSIAFGLIVGCSKPFYQNIPPQPILNQFSLCYENNEVEAANVLRFDGYYKEQMIISNYDITGNTLLSIDTSYRNIVFFKDGIVQMDIWDSNLERTKKGQTDIQLYVDDLIINPKVRQVFLESREWGIFRIVNDTIIIQYFNHPARLAPWYAIEAKFKIKDSTSLERVMSRKMGITDDERERQQSRKDISVVRNPATFVPLNNIPPSDCWLKRQKWFWCNEDDWINYMNKH